MTESGKVGPRHLERLAFVYVRQSTAGQVEHHRESPIASMPSRNAPAASAGPYHAWS